MRLHPRTMDGKGLQLQTNQGSRDRGAGLRGMYQTCNCGLPKLEARMSQPEAARASLTSTGTLLLTR